MPVFSLAQLTDFAARALMRAGANPAMAAVTAAALVDAEAQGLASHGMSRVPQYLTHLRNGRADGSAVPVVIKAKGGVVLIDAGGGRAFPPCARPVEEAIRRSREQGVGSAGVTRSHLLGGAANHLGP